MKNILGCLVLLVLTGITVHAQLTNDGGTITINSGAKFVLEGSVTNAVNSTINNSGTIELEGSFDNKGTVVSAQNAALTFTGVSDANFAGGTGDYSIVHINKSNANVILTDGAVIDQTLSFQGTNSNVLINGNTLTLEANTTVTNASSTGFIETNGTGRVKKIFDTPQVFEYPIGTTGAYTPLEVNITGSIVNSNSYLEVKSVASASSDIPSSATDYLNRHWDMFGQNFTSYTSVLTGTFVPGDVVGSTSIIEGSFYNGTAWTTTGSGNGTATVNTTTSATNGAFTGFDLGALPVQWISFGLSLFNEDGVQVDWTTGDAINLQSYEVERSLNGKDFERIHIEMPKQENTKTIDYNFLDRGPATGLNYYRIKQIDLDGAFTYSDVKSITVDRDHRIFGVFPNPASQLIKIQLDSNFPATNRLKIYDNMGKLVYEVPFENTTQLDISNYAAGVYFAKLYDGSDTLVATRKWVKISK